MKVLIVRSNIFKTIFCINHNIIGECMGITKKEILGFTSKEVARKEIKTAFIFFIII